MKFVFNGCRQQRLSFSECVVNGDWHPGSVSSTEVAIQVVHRQRGMLRMCNDSVLAAGRASCGITSDVARSASDQTVTQTRYGRCQCLDLPTWRTTLS